MAFFDWTLNLPFSPLNFHLTHWGRDKSAPISQMTFSNAFSWMSLKISLKFIAKVPINNIPALVQIVAWIGTDQVTSHYQNEWWLDYWCIYASLSLNELIIDKFWPSIVSKSKSILLTVLPLLMVRLLLVGLIYLSHLVVYLSHLVVYLSHLVSKTPRGAAHNHHFTQTGLGQPSVKL